MSVELLSIAFNLPPGNTDGPSVTIRRNAVDAIPLPEWRSGETLTADQSLVAYSNVKAQNQVVNIRIRMRGPAGSSFRIRALGPDRTEQQRLGCALVFFYLLLRLLPFPQRERLNMLGDIEPFTIAFPQTQTVDQFSEAERTISLSNHSIGGTGVWVSNTNWRWQYEDDSGWHDIVTTRHRVYCLHDHPTRPWQQDYMGGANPKLPWTDALDIVCEWSAFARSAGDIATAIADGVWNAGSSGLFRYDASGSDPEFTSVDLGGTFNLTRFLGHLQRARGTRPVQCYDCAAAVSTLANLLGADLDQFQFNFGGLPGALEGGSRLLLLIGHRDPERASWTEHEITTVPRAIGSQVWDACLQLNRVVTPTSRVSFIGEPPRGMLFSRYKTLFLEDPMQQTPTRRGRRDIT